MLCLLTTPDRFGLATSSKPWEAFETGCLLPYNIHLSDCYVSDATKREKLPEKVTKVLILGPKALEVSHPTYELEKVRGTPIVYQGRMAMASFHPCDAHDQTSGWGDSEEDNDAAFEQKDTSLTRPSNYFFWNRRDAAKLLDDKLLFRRPNLAFKCYAAPSLTKFIPYARNLLAAGVIHTYIDIECRREDHSLNCIGIAFDNSPVFVLPIYRYDNIRFYGE